jgi:hypothetical protein
MLHQGFSTTTHQNPSVVDAEQLDGLESDLCEPIAALCVPEDAPEAMHCTSHEEHLPSARSPSLEQSSRTEQIHARMRPLPTEPEPPEQTSVQQTDLGKQYSGRHARRVARYKDQESTVSHERGCTRKLGLVLAAILVIPLAIALVVSWSILGFILTCTPWMSLAWSAICVAVFFGGSGGVPEGFLDKVWY